MKQFKDKLVIKINKIIAYFLYLLMRLSNQYKKNQNLWIIGGSLGRVYADNSASLHRYIISNHPNIKVFWVINRDSPDVKRVKEISNNKVLYRHSIKSNVYALLAKVHIVTHGKMDISDYRGDVFKHVFKVHLGHGVQGFKKMKIHPKLKRTFNRDYDLVLANSKFEKNIKESWGLEETRVKILGMPRYDDLLRKSRKIKTGDRKILYMPTWRDWLVGSKNIKDTKYYKKIMNLLSSPTLNKLLVKKNINLNIYLHVNMKKQFSTFEKLNIKNVKLLPIETDLQYEIITSELLITDYSSICWDFLFLDKPVIFYHFDISEYISRRDSYIDLTQNLFGPTVFNSNDVVNKIKDQINGKVTSKTTDQWRRKMFHYNDAKNSKRVVEEIKNNII